MYIGMCMCAMSHHSHAHMCSLQFKQLLIRGLSSLSENSRSGSQVAEWVSATYTGGRGGWAEGTRGRGSCCCCSFVHDVLHLLLAGAVHKHAKGVLLLPASALLRS